MRIAMLTALGLGLGNFVYTGLFSPDWSLGIQRAWFETVACFACGLVYEILE